MREVISQVSICSTGGYSLPYWPIAFVLLQVRIRYVFSMSRILLSAASAWRHLFKDFEASPAYNPRSCMYFKIYVFAMEEPFSYRQA